MAITKDKGCVRKWGGGVLKALIATDAGPLGTKVYTDWLELGYIQESTLKDETTVEEFQDETGNTVASDEAARTVKLTGLLMQSDKETIDFFKETCRGNFYSIYQYQGIVNGYHQEILYGICTIKPLIELATGTKRIPFEITVLENESAIPFSDKDGTNPVPQAELPAGNYAQGTVTTGSDAVIIAADEYYHVQETLVT